MPSTAITDQMSYKPAHRERRAGSRKNKPCKGSNPGRPAPKNAVTRDHELEYMPWSITTQMLHNLGNACDNYLAATA